MQNRKIAFPSLSRLALGLLFVGLGLLVPQKSSAIFPLTATWSCGAYASCYFHVTSNNHGAYQMAFGDGTFSAIQTSKDFWHTYNISQGTNLRHFTAFVNGYATPSSGSPDNIIDCTVTMYRTGVGGDPTTFSGNCS